MSYNTLTKCNSELMHGVQIQSDTITGPGPCIT